MLPEALQLFIAGFTAAFGPCLVFCSPVVVPYIAGTSANLRQSIVRSLWFSLVRVLAFMALGMAVALLGNSLAGLMGKYRTDIIVLAGALIAVTGVIILLGRDLNLDFCRFLHIHATEGFKGTILLGILMGVMPCAARLGVLGYITMRAKNLWQGATLALAFALGEAWSPILLLAIGSGLLPQVLRSERARDILRRTSGALIILIGLRLILRPN
jgi:cytochrome c biogenesis protein CcdA